MWEMVDVFFFILHTNKEICTNLSRIIVFYQNIFMYAFYYNIQN